MIKVLQVICISLKSPLKKLLSIIAFIATWAAIFGITIALLALLFDSTWVETATSWVGIVAGILCFVPEMMLIKYYSKVKRTLEFAKCAGCSLEEAWNYIISSH